MGFLNKINFTRSFALFSAFLLLGSASLFSSEASQPVQAKLVAEDEAIQPGRPFWVGVELKMADGWDTYWRNPGDSGFPTQVNWTVPEGFKVGPLMWPLPEKIEVDGLVAFGYTHSVLLMAEITPPEKLAADQKINIKADVNWLACSDSCVPGNAALDLNMPVADHAPALNPAATALFTNARKALPVKEGDVKMSSEGDQIVFHVKWAAIAAHPVADALFVPDEGEVINYAAPQIFQAKGDEVTLAVKKAHPENGLTAAKGVLILSEKGSSFKTALQVDTTISAPQPSQPLVDGVSSLGVALGLAFLGGIILNAMPCVLPVVALKIFGFVKMANQKRRVILQHGGIFSLGVIISFWILSGALLILRAYGEGVGWGFQLQEPAFVAILASLLFLLGLSLFGVFEMGTSLMSVGGKVSSTSASPLKSSFMSGVLATLVATPCTGPLLGPALGFAMTLPAIQALTIFTSMGLGMAFPYLLFSAFPHLVRFLPKPGNWMIAFKQVMGFLMMATVVWLVWVFGAQTDNMATFVLLGSLLLMAIGAWIFGKWGALTRKRMTRLIASVLASLIIVTGGGAAIMTAKVHSESTLPAAGTVVENGWEAYSPERVEELRKMGTPVFVDFTAKWCLICQANKVILHSSEIQKAFHEKGVVTMIADWTKRDPVITKELEKLGRSGVPVYVLYSGDVDEVPYILPQTLTTHVVQDYLGKLKQKTQ